MKKDVRQQQWYLTLKALVIFLPLIALLVQLIYVSVVSVISPAKFLDAVTSIALPSIISLTITFIGKFFDDYMETNARQKELAAIKESVDTIVPTVNTLSHEMRSINNASIEVLSLHEDFYTKLTKCRLEAKREVLLTQLDPDPPESYEDASKRKSYFASDVDYATSHPNVSIYRILSIETPEKLKWVEGLIEATKDLPNLFLAFINITDISKAPPFPKMLSLQIIDREEVFFLNPQFSYMPKSYKACYYIKNTEVAQIYVEYHKEIWRALSLENSPHGCILKDGKDIRGLEGKLSEIKKKRGWS